MVLYKKAQLISTAYKLDIQRVEQSIKMVLILNVVFALYLKSAFGGVVCKSLRGTEGRNDERNII